MIIRQVALSEAESLQIAFETGFGWKKPDGYFASLCEQQTRNEGILLAAFDEQQYTGHLKIAWQPDYPFFRDNHIPEIQDLNVVTAYRRRGIASKLVDAAETWIRQRSNIAGIGVGMYADYGAAQQMYIRRGYVPDGHGLMYLNQPVQPGSQVNIDDDLVLYLIRHFN